MECLLTLVRQQKDTLYGWNTAQEEVKMKRYLSFPAFVMVFILVAAVAGGTRTHAEDVMVPLIQVEDAVTVSAGTVAVK